MTAPESLQRSLPSPVRRATMIALFASLALMFTAILGRVSVSEACANAGDCSAWEQLWLVALAVAWASTVVVTATFGWQGRLPGARAR